MPTAAPSRYRRRRGAALAVVLALLAAGAWVLVGSSGGSDGTAGSGTPVSASEPAGTTVADLLERARPNADGSVTVRADEVETGSLVRAGLERADAPPVDDLAVDLVDSGGAAAGQMVLTGRLREQRLPIRATVDLRVVDQAVRPTVRDVDVGPIPVPDGVRRDLNARLARLSLIAAEGLAVRDVRTTDGRLVVIATPR